MISSGTIIVLAWLVFIVVWGVSAFGAKKNRRLAGGWRSGRGIAVRFIVALVVFVVAINQPAFFRKILRQPFSGAAPAAGAALTVAGVAFAVWARFHIGRDWSSYPTLKEDHRLVTSGPYRFVRHPIYTGMLLAISGSALAAGPFWLIVFAGALVVFIFRIRAEERLMLSQFPDTYPAYQARTEKLIPFVW
ncbi:isoprenylcysteine carboxylmethyltransferase family protein [Patescibacteria group bacterium]|nr:isoprenylcysteine carboxylmethyltransferase family protein [Patescibacteria group bacterium]